MATAAEFDRLVEINLGDIYESLGVKRSAVLDAVFRWPARRFARQMFEFDRRVGVDGLRSAAAWAARQFAGAITVVGAENIPASGPVLIVSNHPGLSDTIDLFASIPRDDLRIVAAHRPFLVALTNLTEKLVFVQQDAGARMGAFRSVIQELKAGRAVLTFPAGKIEPDPGIRRDDARASLSGWIESTGLLARLMPEMRIVPAIVSGVFSPAAYRNPLALRKPELAQRERMAAMMQVMWPGYQNSPVRLCFGSALHAAALTANGADAAAITALIREAAAQLV